MTIDKAIHHAEEVAEEHERHLKIYESIDEDRPLFKEEENECKKCAEEHRQLAEWLKDYKRLKEQTRWIPIEWKPFGKNGYPKPEDEYKNFLTIDDKGEITIQEFLLSLDEEPQPYFTGMRKIIAWMPLPEAYKGE